MSVNQLYSKLELQIFFFSPKTTCSAVWSGDLIDYIHRAGECFHVLNCVELQFHIEQNLTFFSCETSSVIYWCNKLWASGFGLSFYFYSFFSRKSQTFPVICGTVWDSLHKLLQPLFHSSQYQGLLLYVRIVSQIGTWPWWRVTLPSNSPRSSIKLLKSRKAPLHILFMSLAGTVMSRECENTTHKFVFHTRDFQDLCIQNESTLWWVRVWVGWYLPLENWTTVFKSHGHQADVHLRSSMLSGGWWLFCTQGLLKWVQPLRVVTEIVGAVCYSVGMLLFFFL